ncbi:NADH dehydrogenase [ubiquinone] 1 beta subcomplex subunit 1 isoform X3 [Hylobates moloch]|uniref:NADH dehydrogenase [ubiquinone] 1 beta subcomplex subunit 1 isoform X3 n=1 Tax=Hylobates moloch TaxID=81572 RepID=UPI0026752CF4|nr:NADH dehydrogenase [ubiquinone] 1 beta subcomplex subunit 1 isoform X3 [Hylobates moloch]XP_058285555.1 NADH dehydrogenase [ubiquinone] 1 beta subcomplex subunit 1 isoform X3 [Hylobates moloch]
MQFESYFKKTKKAVVFLIYFFLLAIMVNLLQIVRDHWVHVLVPMGFVIGYYLDTKSDERLTAFRNKSMLFKRDLQPSEEVTWK